MHECQILAIKAILFRISTNAFAPAAWRISPYKENPFGFDKEWFLFPKDSKNKSQKNKCNKYFLNCSLLISKKKPPVKGGFTTINGHRIDKIVVFLAVFPLKKILQKQ